ncbi:hydantoinase/carbamoylase family amidase [Gammaproteobacteria bacterium]|jgi:N-carbamoyl-L-amino-acid hydrolase|nr:hydantoinase/carbamoylase family amidase [Gammaproteobacteria bacterium]
MLEISPERLLNDLNTLRSFGSVGNGVVRTAFSDIDMDSRHWLADQLTSAGLEASIDGVGNVIGKTRNCSRSLLIGSHSDTQPTGGWLDGALGVIYGLEIARAWHAAGLLANVGIDVASWMDEEGTYFSSLGSRSFCGEFTDAALLDSRSICGQRMGDLLQQAGLEDTPRAILDTERYLGYLEAHIEQGPFLEQAGYKIGVVTSIVGVRDYVIHFHGSQNHAGTTPMDLRQDAGMAAVHAAYGLDRMLSKSAREKTVWTLGDIKFHPGAASIVPGEARVNFQVRDADEDFLDSTTQAVKAYVEEFDASSKVALELELLDDSVHAVEMNQRMQVYCTQAAERLAPGEWMKMQSGAAHDAQVLAPKLASGMIFVPSIGGISHDFNEDTADEDIILGCRVLAAAVEAILHDETEKCRP